MKRTWAPRTPAEQSAITANRDSARPAAEKSKYLEANAEDDGFGWNMSDKPMDPMYTIKRRMAGVDAVSQSSFLDRVRQGSMQPEKSPVTSVPQPSHSSSSPAPAQPKTNPFSRINSSASVPPAVHEPTKKKHRSKDNEYSARRSKKDSEDKVKKDKHKKSKKLKTIK